MSKEHEEQFVSLEGPVERLGEELGLRIPLAAGGDKLVPLTKGLGVVEGDFLVITLYPKIAEMLGVVEGSHVHVDNRNGEFNIRAANTQ